MKTTERVCLYSQGHPLGRTFNEGEDVPTGYFANPSLDEEYRPASCNEYIGALTDEEVEQVAKACHDANRAYCKSIGDDSVPTWGKARAELKESVINGVENVIENPDVTPEQSHENWLKKKQADGWTYGEQKDVDKKTHPCFRTYAELPEEQRKKDDIFLETARAELAKIVGA